mmetsp:Transcript_56008/g.130952  ORF Transcript_56008/g.130952 Transcript_56008/m.130952 type:complete len:148 (+) Transcript_56008:114-557(+)
MTEKKVKVFGLTSEPQDQADLAQKEWGISYPIIGCQDVSLASYLKEQGLFAPVVSAHSNTKSYPNGMVQPALAFIRSRDRAVIFRWVCVPNSSNFHGATYRPKPADVWHTVKKKLDAPASDLPISDANMEIDGMKHMFASLFCTCCK